jgi:hypothetical protein
MIISYDVLSTPNNCVQLDADQREAVASRKTVFALAPFPFSLEIFGTARSRQGRAGFGRRSEPFHEKVGPCQEQSVAFAFFPFAFLTEQRSVRWWACQGHVCVAKRILDRPTIAHTISVQSEGEEKLPTNYYLPASHRVAPSFHPHSQWTVRPVHVRILRYRRCDLDGGFLLHGLPMLEPGFARSHLLRGVSRANRQAAVIRLL